MRNARESSIAVCVPPANRVVMPGQTYAVLGAKTHVLRFHAWTKMRIVDKLATDVATPCLAEVAVCPRGAGAGANPINVVAFTTYPKRPRITATA